MNAGAVSPSPRPTLEKTPTPTSEVKSDSGELQPPATQRKSNPRQSAAEKMPTESKITLLSAPRVFPIDEEFAKFFSAYEKKQLNEARERWNFDFEKEEPLEGKYEWVKVTSGGEEVNWSREVDQSGYGN